MSDDYGSYGKRKSKRDKRAKGLYNKYKKGGKFRSTGIVEGQEEKR